MDEQKAEQHKLDHAEAPLATMPAVNQVHAGETDLVLHGKYGTTAIDDEDIKLTFKTYVIVASVSLLSLAITLGIAGPTGLVTSIVRTVGGGPNATWVINSVNIMQGVAGPPMALMADLYGRRWTLIVFTCSGVAGTFVAGTATSMGQVIAGQALTGVALALKPICYAIASEVLPRKYRAIVQYWISILAGLGGFIGTIAGPAFLKQSSSEGWRYFFYLEGAFFVVSLAGVVLFYKPPHRDVTEASRTITERFKAFDWIGWFLLAAGFTLLVAGLAFGGNRFPWKSGETLGPLLGGLLALVAFVLYEIYGRSDGLCHHALFKERNFALSLIGIALEGMLLYAFLSIYSQQVLKVWTTDALDQGLRIMPFWLANLVICFPLAWYTTKYKDVKLQLGFGYLLFIIANILMTTATVSGSTQSVIADTMAGAGFAAPLTLLILVAQLCTPPALIATATALMSTSRALAGAVAVAIYSAIYTNKLKPELGPSIAAALVQAGLPPAQVPQTIPRVIASVNAGYVPALVPGVSPAILSAAYAAARQSHLKAYSYVWILATVLGVPALISVYLMNPVRHHMNARIDAPAEDVHANYESSKPKETSSV